MPKNVGKDTGKGSGHFTTVGDHTALLAEHESRLDAHDARLDEIDAELVEHEKDIVDLTDILLRGAARRRSRLARIAKRSRSSTRRKG